MSDRATIKNLMNDANSRESMHPYHCLWIDHWTQTRRRKAPSRVSEDHTVHDECEEEDRGTRREQLVIRNAECVNTKLLDTDRGQVGISESHRTWRCGHEGESDGPQSTKQVVPETRKIVIEKELLTHKPGKMNPVNIESVHLESSDVHKLFGSSMSLESFKKVTLPHFTAAQPEQRAIPKFDSKQKTDVLESRELTICNSTGGMSGSGVGTTRPHLVHKSLALPCIESMSKDNHHEEGMVQTPRQQIRPNFLERTLPHKRSWQGDFVASTSGSGLHRFKALEANTRCRIGGQENRDNLANDRFTPMELECGNHGSYSAFLAYSAKMSKQINANSSESPCSGQKCQALQINGGPLTGNFHLSGLVGDSGRSIQNESATIYLSDHNSMPVMAGLEDSKCGFYHLHKMPTCSLHDMEMLRISSTLDSMEEVTGGLPKVLKTTHQLLIAKKTDRNLSKGDHMVIESALCTEFKGNGSRKMLGQLPASHCCRKQEAVFRYVGDGGNPAKSIFSCTNNESSAETDTLPVDAYQSRYSPQGATYSQLHKDVTVRLDAEQFPANLFSQSKNIGVSHATFERPAANKELPLALAQECNVDNRDLSVSRTESFEAEHLLSHLEQPENSHIGPSQGGPPDPAQSSRWVKRLRSGASDSLAFATKNLEMGDTLSSENVNKLFSRIVTYSKTSSEPTSGKCLISSQSRPLGKAVLLLKNRESSSANSMKDHHDQSTYSWIQRWRRNQDWRSQERPIPKVVCGPKSSKVALEELPRKQFPSIAAMALMRKAVNNFSPCEFRKTGSFVVWSTKGC